VSACIHGSTEPFFTPHNFAVHTVLLNSAWMN
jgi:hypothetical protein